MNMLRGDGLGSRVGWVERSGGRVVAGWKEGCKSKALWHETNKSIRINVFFGITKYTTEDWDAAAAVAAGVGVLLV